MRRYFLVFLTDLRQSYWFVPSVMTVVALIFGLLVPYIDARLGNGWMDGVPFLIEMQVDGARTLLATIAGSVLGVAGVSFSIAIAAVSFASANYGPRLIGNFMRDRGNQFTLGTFVATFVYCMVVLRAVHPALGSGESEIVAFVPQIALLVALGLMLSSIGVLIFFIHHVPESINIMNIAARIGRELRDAVHTLLPDENEDASDDGGESPVETERDPEKARVFRFESAGYLLRLDLAHLNRMAEKHGLTVEVVHRPGSFLTVADDVLRIWPEEAVEDDVLDDLAGGLAHGSERTGDQDVLFLVDQLVEIAARALSPGINDPFTANTCLNWLRVGLLEFARVRPEGEEELPENERVVVRPVTFEGLMSAAFDQARQYIATDRNATLHAMGTLAAIGAALEPGRRRAIVLRHLEMFGRAARLEADEAYVEECERRLKAARRAILRGDKLPPFEIAPHPRKRMA